MSSIGVQVAKGCVYAGAAAFVVSTTCAASYFVTKDIGRRIYPLSKYDGKDHDELPDYIQPNMGIRIDDNKYEQLSTIRKTCNAALLLATGALTGAITGLCTTGIVILALNPLSPTLLILIGTIGCSILGGATGLLHDPKVGFPFIYSML